MDRKYFIIWKTLGNFDHAVIDYSYNGGVDWYSIVSPTNNNGSYEWTIPNTPSPNCLVRIRNYENSSVEAISDTFTIEPQSINMSYPIQSDSFVIGRKYYITWDYSGAFSSVNIEYSIDGGANWTAITSSPVTNNQRYLWTIPDAPGNQTLVRVINSANLNVIGVSDTFSIIPQKITVISPDSNDEFTIGRKYYINWWNTGVFSKSRIEYSYDYENSWNTIVDNVSNSGSYEWTIPNTPSDSCFIKVSNHDNPSISGISPLFRIPLQTIEITSPSSIDTLISGRKYYITWKWNGTFSKVDIQFSVDNGATWSYIANNASNNGNYEWTIPTVNSGNCLVKISNTQNAAVYNISNKFAILPQQITITSPNANDTLLAGRKYYITWRTKGIFNQANIWYSLNGGQDWNVMATNVTNNGYYEWQLPESPSQNVNIKIGNSSQPSVFAISDTFQISPPILTFISP
ncbi:MAG: hypothetical protein GWP10_07740, partial [Nitrospiraceae bacterium]|nr:hypothetical protein [Nitrospiraceae bacterium]